MKTTLKAWRIEPNGAALYCESLPGETGDYGYTTDSAKALQMTRAQARKFCAYQREVGREAKSTENETRGKRAPETLFFIAVTDTFGGEANYSWITRHIIRASTERGAVNKFSRASGYEWHGVGCERYDSKSGATCFFISHYDHEAHSQYLSYQTDERTDAEKQGCIDEPREVRAAYTAYLAGFEKDAETGPFDFPTWKANQTN
jgi:hypothetical protein